MPCRHCGGYFEELRNHERNCCRRRSGRIDCHDCGKYVASLKAHRANSCPRSRKARAAAESKEGDAVRGSPGSAVQNVQEFPTSFVLLDVSGSMSNVVSNGDSLLAAAKDVISENFDKMNDNERFSLITFDNSVHFKIKPHPVGKLRRKDGGIESTLDRIYAQGGTAIYDAIYTALTEMIRCRDDVEFYIIVVTDGDDNSSVHTMDDVLAAMKRFKNLKLDIIHVGVRANHHYSTLCASAQHGGGRYIPVTTNDEFRRAYSGRYGLRILSEDAGLQITTTIERVEPAPAQPMPDQSYPCTIS